MCYVPDTVHTGNTTVSKWQLLGRGHWADNLSSNNNIENHDQCCEGKVHVGACGAFSEEEIWKRAGGGGRVRCAQSLTREGGVEKLKIRGPREECRRHKWRLGGAGAIIHSLIHSTLIACLLCLGILPYSVATVVSDTKFLPLRNLNPSGEDRAWEGQWIKIL